MRKGQPHKIGSSISHPSAPLAAAVTPVTGLAYSYPRLTENIAEAYVGRADSISSKKNPHTLYLTQKLYKFVLLLPNDSGEGASD